MNSMYESVEKLIERAGQAPDSGDAMRFAQAAQNAANAMCALGIATKQPAKEPDK